MKGLKQELCMTCTRPSCIWPDVCRNLDTNHSPLTELYRKVDSVEGVKKSFIGSGLRYDMLFADWNPKAGRAEREYLGELVAKHVSGRLKVAPEHTSESVLFWMRKMPFNLFVQLKKKFYELTGSLGLPYEIIPYFISSHPGCTENDMKKLAEEMKRTGIRPEQVQDFTPTPMTLSTLMYYTGFDPYTGKKVYVARNIDEKKRQKEYFFWYRKKHFPGKKESVEKRK